MTHDITLTSASTEMGFTLSSIWGSVVAKLLALLEYYLSRAEGVGEWTKQFCAPVCTLPTPTCLPSGAICFLQLTK